jgi:putative glycosyltransferase (TIGR04372 family)
VRGKLNKIILNYIFIWPWLNIDVERLIRINEKNIYSENFFNIHKFQLNLNNKIHKNKLLEDLDINSNKYICIHVRNSGYSPSDDDRFIYRNGDHDNFNLTIKYLKKLNYKIVIVGHKNKFINPDIINYANSSFKNLKNDILLISGCDYFIGNTSGLHLLAWVFNVKVLLVNIIPYCSTPYFDDILYIRKDLIFNKLLNDYDLNIIDNAFHDHIYKDHGVDYIENSNEKILKFIKENIY